MTTTATPLSLSLITMNCGFILVFFLFVVVPTCTEDLLVRQVVDNVEDHAEQQFNIFKSKYNKNYKTKEEHDYRFGVFKAKLKFIEERNKINKAAHKNYKLGINYFLDLTYEERCKGCARVEPARVEPARIEPARIEPARIESARVEPARIEPSRVESARVEPEVEETPPIVIVTVLSVCVVVLLWCMMRRLFSHIVKDAAHDCNIREQYFDCNNDLVILFDDTHLLDDIHLSDALLS